VTRLLHLVADYGGGDLAYAELVQRVALIVPGTEIVVTQVPPGDTLAAGYCVARLALTPGPADRLVVHDVGMQGPETAGIRRFCFGRTRDGVAVVGANVGFAWSFVAEHVSGPCYLEVPADGPPLRAPELLAAAIVRVANRQPHAIAGIVPRGAIRPAPVLTSITAAEVERFQPRLTSSYEPPGSRSSRRRPISSLTGRRRPVL
jgi:hypothetical protein